MIYLGGVIMACFVGLVTGNTIPTVGLNWGPKKPNTFCNVLHTSSGEALSKIPLSIVVYTYSFLYFAVPIYKSKLEKENIWFFCMFSILILFDIIWLYIFECGTAFTMFLSLLVGVGTGMGWGEIVYRTDIKKMKNLDKEQCTLPEQNNLDKTKYKCIPRKKKESFINMSEIIEPFENDPALTRPFVTCSLPPLQGMPSSAPGISLASPSANATPIAQPQIYRFVDSKVRAYPTPAIIASWNNGDPNPTPENADCSLITEGPDMYYNLDYYGITTTSYYSEKTLTIGVTQIMQQIVDFKNKVLTPAAKTTQQYLPVFYTMCGVMQETIQKMLVSLNKQSISSSGSSSSGNDMIQDTDSMIQYYSQMQSLVTILQTALDNTPAKFQYADPDLSKQIANTLQGMMEKIKGMMVFSSSSAGPGASPSVYMAPTTMANYK